MTGEVLGAGSYAARLETHNHLRSESSHLLRIFPKRTRTYNWILRVDIYITARCIVHIDPHGSQLTSKHNPRLISQLW